MGLNAALLCPLTDKKVSGVNDGVIADWTGRESGLMMPIVLSSAENVVDGTGLVNVSFVSDVEVEDDDDDGSTTV